MISQADAKFITQVSKMSCTLATDCYKHSTAAALLVKLSSRFTHKIIEIYYAPERFEGGFADTRTLPRLVPLWLAGCPARAAACGRGARCLQGTVANGAGGHALRIAWVEFR